MTHHGILVEGDGDVVEALEDGLVVLLHHLLQQLDVLEDGQPELGHALHVLLAHLLLVLLLQEREKQMIFNSDGIISLACLTSCSFFFFSFSSLSSSSSSSSESLGHSHSSSFGSYSPNVNSQVISMS